MSVRLFSYQLVFSSLVSLLLDAIDVMSAACIYSRDLLLLRGTRNHKHSVV